MIKINIRSSLLPDGALEARPIKHTKFINCIINDVKSNVLQPP
jgi:hypothetical protein